MKTTYARKTVPVYRLRPNPFRRMHEYTIIRWKVDALKESIAQTGFWPTIVGRETEDGVEIAFGHHRMIALQETHDPAHEIPINIADLSNEAMLKMMARENMEEWGTSAWVEMETIRATIEAYGKGLIQLPAIPPNTRKQYIRYVLDRHPAHPYTALAVASFLGWTSKNGRDVVPNSACETAIRAIDMIDTGLLQEITIKGLKRSELAAIVEGLRRKQEAHQRLAAQNHEDAKREKARAEAAKTAEERERHEKRATVYVEQAQREEKDARTKTAALGQEAAEMIRRGEGVAAVRRRAEEARPELIRPEKVHTIDDLAYRIVRKLAAFSDDDELARDFQFLKRHINDLTPYAANQLSRSLAALVARLEQIGRTLTSRSSHTDGTEVNGHVSHRENGTS